MRGRAARAGVAVAALAVAALGAAPLGQAAAGWATGTRGADRVGLTNGADRYRALGGADRVSGRGGADVIQGQGGNDHLSGGPGADRLLGGAQRDVLQARDGNRDGLVDGGPGRDVCVVDPSDRGRIRGCETVVGLEKGQTPPTEVPVTPQVPADPGPDPVDPGPDPVTYSDAYANRNWTPTAFDTCPKWLHDSYSVVGPDSTVYPGWHPPEVTNPETGARCTFGHEHGRDPSGSDIYAWVSSSLASPGHEDEAGLPFGLANEKLIDYAAANPGVAVRGEDHVGHKVDWANDVTLVDRDGHYVLTPANERIACDFLFKVHQGSHSADATVNNVHELVYAAKCNDGTELISTTIARFGPPDQYQRSCEPATTVISGTTSPWPSGGGERILPDRGCLERYVLVPPGSSSAASDIWALYENWKLEGELKTQGGATIASFDPWFAVRNPSRYAWPGTGIGRTLSASWETDSTDNGVVNRAPWTNVSSLDPFEYRDPRSPFDGAQRDFYLRETTVRNSGGPEYWYTDPYGRNGQSTPFPGAICQLVGTVDNSSRPELRRRLFARDADYGDGNGVHAPN